MKVYLKALNTTNEVLFVTLVLKFINFQVHKRRMKALELEPYSIEESEQAAGLGSFKQAQKRKIETQPSKQELEENPDSIKKLKTESM